MKHSGKNWGKTILVLLIAAFSAVSADAQENEEAVKGKYDWVKGFFFDFNTLYSLEDLKAKEGAPEFESHNLSLEFGLGYDFGLITARLYGGFGFLLGGTAFWSNETESISKNLDASRGHFGIEGGVKLIDTSRFDLIIPLGLLFHWTTYEQKDPSYADDQYGSPVYPYDRKWIYDYMSIVSGLLMKIALGKHIALCIPFSIGYPVVRNADYEETLRGGVTWGNTGSSTWSEEFDTDVFTLSAGIGIRVNL